MRRGKITSDGPFLEKKKKKGREIEFMPPSVAMFPVRILLLINLSDGRRRAALCLGSSQAKWQPHEKGPKGFTPRPGRVFFPAAARVDAC